MREAQFALRIDLQGGLCPQGLGLGEIILSTGNGVRRDADPSPDQLANIPESLLLEALIEGVLTWDAY